MLALMHNLDVLLIEREGERIHFLLFNDYLEITFYFMHKKHEHFTELGLEVSSLQEEMKEKASQTSVWLPAFALSHKFRLHFTLI